MLTLSQEDKEKLEAIADMVKSSPDVKPERKQGHILTEQSKWLSERFKMQAPKEMLPIIGLDAGATAALASLIVSLVGAFLNNFIQIPILDYEVVLPSDSKNNHYEIKVNNYGNALAEHVLI